MHSIATKPNTQLESSPTDGAYEKPLGIKALEHISLWSQNTKPLQTSLKINAPGDKYEQEADRVAEQVMRTPEPKLKRETCSCGKPMGTDGECAACNRKKLGIQRLASSDAPQTTAPPIVHQVLQQPGRPLDGATRNFMESRFGQDFGRVRVHRSSHAANAAEAINARAFTVGSDIVFGANAFSRSHASRQLIAHELVHVMQQSHRHNVVDSPSIITPQLSRTPSGIIHARKHVQRATPNANPTSSKRKGQEFNAGKFIGYERLGTQVYARYEATGDTWISASALEQGLDVTYSKSQGYGAYEQIILDTFGEPFGNTDRVSPRQHYLVPVADSSQFEPEEPILEETKTEDSSCQWFNCGSFYNMFPAPIADLVPNAIDCQCEIVKFADMFDDFLALVPGPVGLTFGHDQVQKIIGVTDLLCGFWDLLEMAYKAGCSPGPCWDTRNIDYAEAGRIIGFSVSLVFDYKSDSLLGGIISTIARAIATIGEAILAETGLITAGPVGSFMALLGSETLKAAIEIAMKMIAEFMIDVNTYLIQNQLTHGTMFPLDSCRACAGLATVVGVPDYTSVCDTIAEAVTHDRIHWKSWDPDILSNP